MVNRKATRGFKHSIALLGVFSVLMGVLFFVVRMRNSFDQDIPSNQYQHELNWDGSLSMIEQSNYADINFLKEEIHIDEAKSTPNEWQTWSTPDGSLTISHPRNRKVNPGSAGVGFCQVDSCHDFFPVISRKEESIFEIIDAKANCVLLHYCYGRNISVAAFSLGSRKGIAVYFEKLTSQQLSLRSRGIDTVGAVENGSWSYYLLIGQDVYELLFDQTDQTQKQMISTLRFQKE